MYDQVPAGCDSSPISHGGKHSLNDNQPSFCDPDQLLSDILFVKGRILSFVPRGSRVQWALTLTECMDRILQDPTDPARWRRLMLAASLCLRQPERGGHSRRTSLTSLINKQCSAFRSSTDLLSLSTSIDPPQRRKSDGKNSDSKLSAVVSRKLDEGDVRGAVRLVSSSDTIAPFDEATLLKLRQKHPPRPNDRMAFPRTDVPPLQVETQDVRSAVESFKAGSSGGCQGFVLSI